MCIRKVRKTIAFRGSDIQYSATHYFCPVCNLEVDDLGLAAVNQKAMAEAYRKAQGLLTSKEIADARKKLGWNQAQLAKAINVGIASIKRWETGQIQTPAMDRLLRQAIKGQTFCGDVFAGNRIISLSRIKLVLTEFERALKRDLLKEGDKMLYSAKYLFYADMLAFLETGQGMTGAPYAALPQGPQLNNYRELFELIRQANEQETVPLTDIEKRIIKRIAIKFPTNTKVYKGAHDEPLWKNKNTGELIAYGEVIGLEPTQ
jgi:putative zinc finger/helix-turn-helix YgiT family protein